MKSLKSEVGWSASAFRRTRQDRDTLSAAFIVQLVAMQTGIAGGEIASATRHCAEAAKARQLAIYLTHTAWGWPLARVAAAFGRDRSTASYACQKVEDRREDKRYDAVVAQLEGCARAAPVSEAKPGSIVQ